MNFIAAEMTGGEYSVQADKFASVIFPELRIPPPEILLAAEDYGKVYFVAPKPMLPDIFKPFATSFDLEQNVSLFELEISPNLKQELRRYTPRGQLDAQKSELIKVVERMPAVLKKFNALSGKKKNPYLDEYIAEVTRAETVLAEIFPLLHSDTIKFNFNLFKEFLIDFRLYDTAQLKKIALEDLNRQYEILLQYLKNG